jgi:endogenous inhibitor of DNA gyrase (YacG/DUF329 family)
MPNPSSQPRVVSCPTCAARVEWTAESRWRPFCSERCKLIDLGAWANEAYRIPAVERDDEATPPERDDR